MAAKKTRKNSTKKTPKKRATKKKASAKKAPAKKKAAKKTAAKPRSRAKKADRVDEIQRLIDVMVEAGAVEVEMEDVGTRLRVRLKEDAPAVLSYAAAPAQPVAAPLAAPAAAPAAAGPAPAEPEAAPETGEVFTSPMVGTFYASPSPDSDPFVRVGDRVTADSTLCILEAMKVMNEIKSEISGSVSKILVQDGQPVEFGQPLFVIEAD